MKLIDRSLNRLLKAAADVQPPFLEEVPLWLERRALEAWRHPGTGPEDSVPGWLFRGALAGACGTMLMAVAFSYQEISSQPATELSFARAAIEMQIEP
jgi:hypothetical protein